jgi:hypothetical protein
MQIEKGLWYLCQKSIGFLFTKDTWYFSPKDDHLNANNGQSQRVAKFHQKNFTGGIKIVPQK